MVGICVIGSLSRWRCVGLGIWGDRQAFAGSRQERECQRGAVVGDERLDETRAVGVGEVGHGGDEGVEEGEEGGDFGGGDGVGYFQGGHVQVLEGHEPEVWGRVR